MGAARVGDMVNDDNERAKNVAWERLKLEELHGSL
jgi:hypothetical protein